MAQSTEFRPAGADGFTDIRNDAVIFKLTPRAFWPFAQLARLDRLIGVWLLLYPCLWGLALASDGITMTTIWYGALFVVGATVMRGAGCTVNDILDRHFDAQVERTRGRPIPSGRVGVPAALMFLAAQLVLGLIVLLQFNMFTIWLGVASLVLVFTYPLMKRVTWWPQAFLGLAFNWGALVGVSAVAGELTYGAVALYVAGIAWTLGYDTIYAHQDKEDDIQIGVKSTALRLGESSKTWVFGFYTVTVAGLWLAGLMSGLSATFQAVLTLTTAQLAWQVGTWNPDDQVDCLAKFRSNRWVGVITLLAIIAGKL